MRNLPNKHIKGRAANNNDSYITYKSVKFFQFPNVSGTVPLKSFADRMLYNKVTISQASLKQCAGTKYHCIINITMRQGETQIFIA